MDKSDRFRFERLRELLLSLGFTEEWVEGSHRAFRHEDSDTLIVLSPSYVSSTPVRDEDLVSVRRHLEEKGLANAAVLSALATAVEPHG